MKIFIFLLCFIIPTAVASARDVLHSEAEITIDRYVESADAFVVTNNIESDVGPNYAATDALKKAIGNEGTMKEFRNKISSLIGTVVVLKEDLPLLSQKEFDKRKKSKPKN